MAKYKVTLLRSGGNVEKIVEANSFNQTANGVEFYREFGCRTHAYINVLDVELVEEDEPEAKVRIPDAKYRLTLSYGPRRYADAIVVSDRLGTMSVKEHGTGKWMEIHNISKIEVL